MAILKSKQLNPNLTGSFVLSGSSQSLIGTTTIKGSTTFEGTSTVSGSLNLKGPSVDLNIRSNDNTNIVRLLTTTGGTSGLTLYDNFNHPTVTETININSSDQNALVVSSGSSTIFTIDRDNTLISGSATSTGSFGRVETSGDIAASGNISSSANITGNVVNVKTRVKAIGSSVEFAGNTLDFVDGSSTSRLFKGTSGGAFEAYYSGNKKFETTSTGISITGNVLASGNISGSSTSTGSFGTLETSGEINASGRIYEAGSSVIDHATAMAIVFGG